MNREQLLLGGVLALVALWAFALREVPKPRSDVKPGSYKIETLPVKDASYEPRLFYAADAFTVGTNEQDHPRPMLPLPREVSLDDIWPPTSRTVSVDRYGRLRRPAVAPTGAAATIELPALPGGDNAPEGAPGPERVDTWLSYGQENRGRVVEIVLGRKSLREPKELPPAGKVEGFYRLLMMLEVDPEGARAEGVTKIGARMAAGGTITPDFDGNQIRDFKIAAESRDKGWYQGLRTYLGLPKQGGYQQRTRAGETLLEYGRSNRDMAAIDWALVILDEARRMVPEDAPDIRRSILRLMLDAANRRNKQELVLQLAFGYLARFPQDPEVLEYVGSLLESRSFDLPAQADTWFARAAQSKEAQRRRVGVLIRLGRFEEARRLIESNRAGTGPEVDMLLARVALALGDFETARSRARGQTGGDERAEANQILGGVAYAAGDAEEAERYFRAAVEADPTRSTAYSDLGLALAVQGKDGDALVCLRRAAELDFENAVVPKIGEAFLKLTANDVAGARAILDAVRNDNPGDLLVRYYCGYAEERAGELEAAAETYRKVLDDDHRYRIAIARLGLTQANRVEAGGDVALAKPAEAHLQKAVDLNPEDAVLPYILARFLMSQDLKPKVADELFAKAGDAKAPADLPDVGLWAQTARAAIAYRNASIEPLKVKSMLVRVQDEIKRLVTRRGAADPLKEMTKDPVYMYAATCLEMVQENEKKVDVTWTFGQQRPRDWEFHARESMKVIVATDGGIEFKGRVDYKGERRDHNNVLLFCAAEYPDRINGNDFYEIEFEGDIPADTPVSVGLGLVGKASGGSRSSRGRTGIQLRRQAHAGRPEIRLDGANEIEIIKKSRADDYLEMGKVSWPAGPFTLKIVVTDRKKGLMSVFLNGTNVLEQEWGAKEDACRLFTRGGASQRLSVVMWVEGNDGEEYARIKLNKVTLTKSR